MLLGAFAGFRLSLPHIIGLIVSIGITADSFIVYFERIRDEMKEGRRSLRTAIEVAWVRARRTILIADAVMFIAAVVLYFLAVGGVAGFAFAMGLTTLIDIAVGVHVHQAVRRDAGQAEVLRQGAQALRARRRAYERGPRQAQDRSAGGLMSGIARRLYRGEVDVDFVGRKKLWYTLSAILLVISIAGLIFNGLNLGVEFKGGSVLLLQGPDGQHRAGARHVHRRRRAPGHRADDPERLAGHHGEPPGRPGHQDAEGRVHRVQAAGGPGQPAGDRRLVGWPGGQTRPSSD
ncbi:hypothetical protein [Streptosporangium vulgare]|uniref:hypothetical protein n=1 Tax=Streptosporangium vulgare TaxID=46190 RepID=UPI0031E3C334